MTKLSMIAVCLLLPGCLGQAYEADAGATPDPLSWCLPYAEVDAPPGSGSLPDPVPGRTCHTETSGNLIYWCCVSVGVE